MLVLLVVDFVDLLLLIANAIAVVQNFYLKETFGITTSDVELKRVSIRVSIISLLIYMPIFRL